MKSIAAGVIGVSLLLAGAVLAADVTGEVQGIDRQQRLIQVTLPGDCVCNAVTYQVPAIVDMGWLTPGVTVNLTFTTANNVNVVTKLAK